MEHLRATDIMTRVHRYNLIRDHRLVYIDVHEALHGKLAGNFVAVPNLVNIIARQEFQGVGETEPLALANCLEKIKEFSVEELFPSRAEENDPSLDR